MTKKNHDNWQRPMTSNNRPAIVDNRQQRLTTTTDNVNLLPNQKWQPNRQDQLQTEIEKSWTLELELDAL